MRNILFFVLFLIGLFYVRRALRGNAGGARPAPDDSGAEAGERRAAPQPTAEIEQMVACAHCGLHVPESEGVRGGGGFFCSEAHRRLGSRQ